MIELGALRGPAALRQGLGAHEPVRYTDGGNRSTDGHELLRRLEELAPRLGVTRLGEISELAPYAFPVFQSARPNIYTHVACGQNTGSQGKGRTPLQAKLSCLMEEVESYSAEPKNVMLIRGTYRGLSRSHVCAYPRKLTHNYQRAKAASTKPLMWTRAYSIEHDCELLVPAETVFFPFCPEDYETESFFPCSSNGLAAGATYLEAVLHGLYEVVERCYVAHYEIGAAAVDALSLTDVSAVDVPGLLERSYGTGDLSLLWVRLAANRNLPMVIARLRVLGDAYGGYGCSANVTQAVDRALSEALQSLAVNISGTREDLEDKRGPGRAERTPVEQELVGLDEMRRVCGDRSFDDLRTELDHLLEFVHELGYQNVFVADLTRAGVDIPVVKVVLPGMPCKMAQREEVTRPLTFEMRRRHRYALGAPEDES